MTKEYRVRGAWGSFASTFDSGEKEHIWDNFTTCPNQLIASSCIKRDIQLIKMNSSHSFMFEPKTFSQEFATIIDVLLQ